MTKGRDFVKNKKTKKFKITCTSSDHDDTFRKVSGLFDQRCGKSCWDKVWVSKGHNFIKNGRNKNQKPHAHLHMMKRQSIKFQISPMKDVRGVAGHDRMEGWLTGRTHTRTDEDHFYGPSPPTSGDNKSRHTEFAAFILLLLFFNYQ